MDTSRPSRRKAFVKPRNGAAAGQAGAGASAQVFALVLE